MNNRKRLKKLLHGYCPGFAGAFTYYGTKVYFPKNSLIFNMACEQGIYESSNLSLILGLLKDGSTYFDVGANIGLMSIPILRTFPNCKVLSFEPSPNTIQFLKRTADGSGFGSRWQIIDKGASNTAGSIDFYTGASEVGALDSSQDTGRAGNTTKVKIPTTTIDIEWESMGRPNVLLIKIDVEGAERLALDGAKGCIDQERPHLLVEWNSMNLNAHHCEPEWLLSFADEINYQILCATSMVPVTNAATLEIVMLRSENFLLSPKK